MASSRKSMELREGAFVADIILQDQGATCMALVKTQSLFLVRKLHDFISVL